MAQRRRAKSGGEDRSPEYFAALWPSASTGHTQFPEVRSGARGARCTVGLARTPSTLRRCVRMPCRGAAVALAPTSTRGRADSAHCVCGARQRLPRPGPTPAPPFERARAPVAPPRGRPWSNTRSSPPVHSECAVPLAAAAACQNKKSRASRRQSGGQGRSPAHCRRWCPAWRCVRARGPEARGAAPHACATPSRVVCVTSAASGGAGLTQAEGNRSGRARAVAGRRGRRVFQKRAPGAGPAARGVQDGFAASLQPTCSVYSRLQIVFFFW